MFAAHLGYLACLAVLPCTLAAQRVEDEDWWSPRVAAALRRAGDNRAEILRALKNVQPDQRKSMAFLVEHMPPKDLASLKADFLLTNVGLAHQVMGEVPWGRKIPRDVFLNDVLPYANVSERRDAWRKEFYERFLPLVKKCKTPGEAAQVLNRKVFPMLKVRYSTKRRRADQSPAESIGIGVASCTGLSIILADACRAVGVPARLAGIPNWIDKRGNHTWVEVWDQDWHFTGAAEPSGKGLNHAWFVGDAAKARADVPEHSIYAVSYKATPTKFPMVWRRRADRVSAVNVTHRYAKKTVVAAGKMTLRVRVRDSQGRRIVADVEVRNADEHAKSQRGKSRGEKNDANDFLSFQVDPKQRFVVRVSREGRTKEVPFVPDGTKVQLVDVVLGATKAKRK